MSDAGVGVCLATAHGTKGYRGRERKRKGSGWLDEIRRFVLTHHTLVARYLPDTPCSLFLDNGPELCTADVNEHRPPGVNTQKGPDVWIGVVTACGNGQGAEVSRQQRPLWIDCDCRRVESKWQLCMKACNNGRRKLLSSSMIGLRAVW